MPPACSYLPLESAQIVPNSEAAAEPSLANSYRETPHTVPLPSHLPIAYVACASAGTVRPTPHPMQVHSPPLFPSPYALVCLRVVPLSAPPAAVAESL